MITKHYLTSSQSQLQEYYSDNEINSYTVTQNNTESHNIGNKNCKCVQTRATNQTLNDNNILNQQNYECLQTLIVCENNFIKQILKLTNQLEHAVTAASSKIKSIWNQQLLIIEQIVDAE
ncbi:Hypothetical_protein [Hexamita inflata]|uniref:Hypothetical_protein n=1 Tax=Hexamita inflata TaxID=28002 RepID=A0AA86NP49_9EUKA|nr:Hypothetical protein HINF_LOCUS10341 [Hexamita inflata]